MKNILITGSTGALGSELIKLLLTQNINLVLLVRRKPYLSPQKRIKKILGKRLHDNKKEYITVIEGDLNHLNDLNIYLDTLDTIIHLSGDVFLGKGKYERLHKTNYIGTKNIISLAKKMPNLKYFMYASTFYISEIFSSYNDVNDYENTKRMAESLIFDYAKDNRLIKVSIVRPSIIIGNSKTGKIENCSGYCSYLHILNSVLTKSNSLSIFIPSNSNSPVNFVFVDWVVKQMKIILDNEYNGVFNLAGQKPPLFGWLLVKSLECLRLSNIKVVFKNTTDNTYELSSTSRMLDKLGLGVFEEYTSRPEIPILDSRLTPHPKITLECLKIQINYYRENFYK